MELQVVVAYAAAARRGTHRQKSRGECAGSGKKPWKQKGSGRARAGSVKSPIWRSGGVAFAARPRDYSQKVNRKMYRGALQSIFAELFRQDRVVVLQDFSIAHPKTKCLVEKLRQWELPSPLLIIVEEVQEALYLASRNLVGVEVLQADQLDPVQLVRSKKILITEASLRRVEELLHEL
eukprot:Blabericola_migrator_1__7894@NODE_4039_length_1364_cov_7_420200_g2490_i0_p1_GENE_NODE_4039_length_1364_cov_7_420200_g2490_i0NODE_4039_length_1364_cov_7_420200_g2490_i0_p1_ORF_typecomplete_len179_score11_35Ribosomal_L4/PF00573_22/1_7e53Peptidase_S66C/PF17676_1/0_44Peptidase_S66C/PF17676_1/4_6e03Peptidase_S66C/PF17676_1/2_5e03SLATT_3/PF18184_1/0_14_NODE_4039_length_1364_cov_7_420200_g2490_i0301837